MNRVLMVFTISLIVGIIFPSGLLFVLVAALILAALYLFCYIKYKWHFILIIILGFISGMLLSNFAPGYDSGEIYKYENEYVSCRLLVVGVPVVTDKYTKFEATVKTINNIATKEKVLVYVYDSKGIDLNQIITFDKIKFKLPDDQRNPGSFDYRKYLTGKEIFFIGTTNQENIISLETAKKTLLSESALLNKKLSDRIDSLLSDKNSGLLKAILLGNKNDVDDNTINHFRNSGLSHIMAVSGLHLSIIVMLLNLFLKKANRWIKFIISFVFVIAFALVVGLPVSVIRAGIMLLILQLTDALFLEGDSLTNLSLAALVILILNPDAVYDIGFVMSFSATFGILSLHERFKNIMPKSMPITIRECVCVTLSAQVVTLPFSAMYFGQLSLLSVISNLLIVVLMPLIYFIGIPMIITSWTPFIVASEMLLTSLSEWAEFCSELPGQMQHIPINPVVLTGLFMFSILCVTSVAFKNKKIVSILLICSLILSAVGGIWQLKYVKGTKITFLNVGQADSTLVQTESAAFLIDTATEYMAESEITGYLLRQGVSYLDGIFISHFDSDHCGGILKLIEQIDIAAIYIPDTVDVSSEQYNLIKHAEINEIPVLTLKQGDKIDFNGTHITVMHPQSNTVKDKGNDASLVLRLDNEHVSALFAGDLEKDGEIENCDTDILKVSHHGSRNGTSETLLSRCTPKIAVMSLARNNSYGFPHGELLERITRYTNKIYRTDLNKTITIKCNNKKYSVKTMNQESMYGEI